jgi:hypothetical protein
MTQQNKPQECPVCDIASAFAVTKGICNTFKERGLDCAEFLKELENPDGKASEAVKAFLKLRTECQLPEAREMLEYITKAAHLDDLEFVDEGSGTAEPPTVAS